MQLPWSMVRPQERQLTLTLSILHFVLIALFTFSKIARDAIFLDKLPASYLPYMYIALAVISAGAIALISRFKGASTSRVLMIYALVVAISFIGFTIWYLTSPETVAITLYLWTGIFGLGLVTEFWLLANEVIDTRAARRLFAVIGASGIAGGLAAGFAATAVGVTLGPFSLLIAVSALGLIAAFIARRTEHLESGETAIAGSEARVEAATSKPWESRYVRLLAGLFLLSGITLAVVDFAFKVLLQEELTDGGAITSALGIFYSIQNLVALIAQLGLAGVLLSRFGGRPIANALPIGILVGAVITLGVPAAFGLLIFVAVPLYSTIMRVSLTRSAWQFLFFPLPDDIRRKAKRTIDVVVNRTADAIAGALLLLFALITGGGFTNLLWLIVLVCAMWVGLELMMNRAYPGEVRRALERQAGGAPDSELKLSDLARPDELNQLLRSGSVADVLYVIDVLEILDPDFLNGVRDELLAHPSPEIRARMLAGLFNLGEDITAITDQVSNVEPEIIDDVSVETAHADNPPERVIEAAAAGNGAESIAVLTELIDDLNRDVRRVAYASAARSGNAVLVREMIRRLAARRDVHFIRSVLKNRLLEVPEQITVVLEDTTLTVSERSALITVLQSSDHPAAVDALCRLSGSDQHRRVASAALSALLSIHRAHPSVSIPGDTIAGDLDADISRYGIRLMQIIALGEGGNPELKTLVETALRERSWQSLERAFTRMSLVYGIERAELAFRSVKGGDKHLASQAIEYLDTHLPRQLKDLIIPMLDASTEEERARKFSHLKGLQIPESSALAGELLSSRDPMLRACALFVIGQLNWTDYHSKVRDAGNDPDPVVRDTAVWAHRRLNERAIP